MKRALGPILAVAFAACSGDRPLMPSEHQPLATISDGNHSAGNPDFFFLPPLVPSPTGNVHFEPSRFNPNLVPVVDVCQLSGDPASGPVTCTAVAFGPVSAQLGTGQYAVNWHTDQSNGGAGLSVSSFYRIRVFGSLGGRLLGFADVDPVSTGKDLKNVQTNEVIGLVDGRTLPIKFSVEDGALCDPPGTTSCSSATVDLEQGATVILEATGDRVIVPAQPDRPDQVITLSLQPCAGLPIDNPVFGPCLRVTADPPIEGPLAVRARVLLCSVDHDAHLGTLTHEQQHLLKVHRFNEGPPPVLQALPEATSGECAGIGSAEPQGVLQWLGRLASRVLAPRELRASSALIDVGDAGSTEFFSLFQLALPVKMEIEGLGVFDGNPDEAVTPAPSVLITDYNGDPVAGARVHFAVTTAGGGSVTPLTVLSDATGHAAVASWVLGAAGQHTLRASGLGIASPGNNGPQEGFDPFQPDITLPLVDQDPVTAGTGEVLFTGNALAGEGTWIAGPSMTNGRRDHTATLLSDGKVLIVGGTGGEGARLFDPATGGIVPTTSPQLFGHGQHATATLLNDGRVLIVGGNSSPFSAEIYDHATGTFTAVATTLFSRTAHTATLLDDGRVLLAAGQAQVTGGPQTHPAAEIFDPATDNFSLTGTLNTDRSGHDAIRLADGRVLVVAGGQTTTPGFGVTLTSAELWDPATGAWTLLASQLADARSSPTMALLDNNSVLVTGGSGLTSAELFDPATQTFSATGSTAAVHWAGSLTFLAGGRVLLAGGVGDDGGGGPLTTNTAEIYDPSSGTWSAAASMVSARQQHTATRLLDGRVLVIGGFSFAADADLSSTEFFSLAPPIP